MGSEAKLKLTSTPTSSKEENKLVFKPDMNKVYLSQLHYFFNGIHHTPIMNNLEEALSIFKQIYNIKKEAKV